jgi:hypothetical protein
MAAAAACRHIDESRREGYAFTNWERSGKVGAPAREDAMRATNATLCIFFALTPTIAFAADETPKRKPGLWELHSEMNGRAATIGPIEQCIDEKTDDLMRQSVADAPIKCEKRETRRDGDKFVIHSICKFQDTTITTDGVFTGDFNANYRGEMHMTYAPPMHGMSNGAMVISAKWLGPCKPGQKAGDVSLPGITETRAPGAGGGKLNLDELMKMREQMKGMQQR